MNNQNDYKVVTFTNKENFAFTPDLGCMYDSRPIFGKSGTSVEPGESVVLPYHVGNLIAKNLAKSAMNKNAPTDPAGIPTGVSMWSEESLKAKQASYIEEMYQETKPTAMSETDKLMAKVEEFKAMVDKLEAKVDNAQATENKTSTYSDKSDVIAELEKREIVHDKRKSKDELEKLLV